MSDILQHVADIKIDCRVGCGACCIAISISSPIPGMPGGKPGGVRCIQLSERNTCLIHNTELYPKVCANFTAFSDMCGTSFDEAMQNLEAMELATKPEK